MGGGGCEEGVWGGEILTAPGRWPSFVDKHWVGSAGFIRLKVSISLALHGGEEGGGAGYEEG